MPSLIVLLNLGDETFRSTLYPSSGGWLRTRDILQQLAHPRHLIGGQQTLGNFCAAALGDFLFDAIVSVLLQHEADVGAALRISRLDCTGFRVRKTSQGRDASSWQRILFAGLRKGSTTRKEQWEEKHFGTHVSRSYVLKENCTPSNAKFLTAARIRRWNLVPI